MVQPLPEGMLFDSLEDIPVVHRPARDVYAKDLPNADVQGRNTPYDGSGTRWCATCHRTLNSSQKRKKFCGPCINERNNVRRIDLAATEFTIDALTLAMLHSQSKTLLERTDMYLRVRTGQDLREILEAFEYITEAGKVLAATIAVMPKPTQSWKPM